ncbi:hypothetical protein [Terriglobus tenax]|uniref:hypothetical protein n=1 Tax=Terriglobus tenax TaxID=1111115 RepID=UPI0021E01278|nr:hypothetical protein [Terriglobus tenax]
MIFSPFIVPVALFTMIAVLGVAGIISGYQEKRLKVEQRIAALQRGIPLDQVEKVFGAAERAEVNGDPMTRLNNIRLTALILICGGAGVIITCFLLTIILRYRQILAGSAGGLIPIAIGVGFWLDYKIQVREMERLGLVVSEE